MSDTASRTVGAFARAVAFATEAHRGQVRKGADADPYISHPLAVVAILADEAQIADWVTLCAAVLHDTIEDTGTSHDDLETAFGTEVADLVAEVSDDKRLPKHVRKADQVARAAKASPKARLVKLADKIANLRDIADRPPATWSLKRKQEYFDWSKAVVDAIRGTNPVLEGAFDATFARRAELT